MEVSIDAQRCTGCNLCVFSCPEEAISCYAIAILDREECNGCLKCVRFCPVNAIKEKGEES